MSRTITFSKCPRIAGAGSAVGKKEGEGPLGDYFDMVVDDEWFGEKTFEKAESKFLKNAVEKAIKTSKASKIDYVFAGDLLNQCISSSYGLREFHIPFIGLYGACSNMAEAMAVGAVFIDGGYAEHVLCATSSHFCSAERQFRFPLEYGGQRPPTAQWTVTGSGAVVLGMDQADAPRITHATLGKIVDYGITDANNMGAAMAPAFCDTLRTHLVDTGRTMDYYDMILSGDLGAVGYQLVTERMPEIKNYNDCGLMIFDTQKQDVHSGGSGCGASATVFSGYVLKKMQEGKIKKLLLIGTGALMSPISIQQGESIPSIAHAVAVEVD